MMNLRIFAVCLIALQPVLAMAAQRAFVASYGSDANTATLCSLQAPCRSFMAAIGVVDSGGEVIALDAGGYGSNITIAKPLTLTANPGFYAGIFATSGTAVNITSSAQKVVLRGLDIKGLGADIGIRGGGDLDVENCRISNFGTAGITGVGKLRVSDTVIRNAYKGISMCGLGVRIDIVNSQLLDNLRAGLECVGFTVVMPMQGGATISITDSLVANNYFGLNLSFSNWGGLYRLAVTRSIISDNWRGIQTSAQAGPPWNVLADVRTSVGASQFTGNLSAIVTSAEVQFQSMGDNVFVGNGDNGLSPPVIVVPGT